MVETKSLHRALRLPDVILFFIVAVVGLRWIATAAAVGPSGLTLWLAALVGFFLPLAFAVVELSSREPGEGGIYVWAKRSFGDFAGFLTAWLYWSSNLVYMPGLLYFAAANALFAFGAQAQGLAANPAYFLIFSFAGLGLAFLLNLLGVSVGKALNNLGGHATWIPVTVLVALGALAFARFGPATSFAGDSLIPKLDMSNALLWSTIAFGFAGLEAASLMGEEIVDPRRTVPRAIVIAGLAVTAIYVLGTLAILVAIPASDVSGLAGILQAIQRVAERVGAGGVVPAMALLVAFGGLGGTGAWLASTARLPFVAGVDRYLPASFGRVHPRFGTPHVALATQTIGAALFVVLSQAGTGVKGAYDALVSMGVITYFVPFLVLFAAYAKVKTDIRTPGGRPVLLALAGLGFATTLAALVLACVPPDDAANKTWAMIKVVGGSALIALAGALVFANGKRRLVAG